MKLSQTRTVVDLCACLLAVGAGVVTRAKTWQRTWTLQAVVCERKII
jgi:hypothetical protein